MAINNTALWAEVQAIINRGALDTHYQLKTVIRCNGLDHAVLKTLSLDINRDYGSNYSDIVVADVTMGMGDFVYDIYPYRKNLEVTVYWVPTGEIGTVATVSKATTKRVYRGILIETESDLMAANQASGQGQFALNLNGLKRFRLQLVDLTTEWVRMEAVGGVFKSVAPWQLAQYLLTQQSKRVKYTAENTIKGVSVATADNLAPRDNIVIPHGTPLVEVPSLLQRRHGGIYSTGLGYYLQDGYWYLYPLYDLTRFNRTPMTLTVINVPKAQLPGLERTYRRTANQAVVLCTGSGLHRDRSDGQVADSGNGVRYQEARSVIDGAVTVTGNRMTFDRVKNTSEFITDTQESGLNHAPVAPGRIHGSGFELLTQQALKRGGLFMAEWEHGDPAILTPGMPVKLMYQDHDQVRTVMGVLLGAHSYYQLQGEGVTATRHQCTVGLAIFVSKAT